MSGNVSLNGTSFSTDSHSLLEKPGEQRASSALLFCWTLVLACTALLGSVFSLVSLLRTQTKTCLSALVTALAVDDLLSVLPVLVFLLAQWSGAGLPRPLCTASALVYLFQGISSNLKGCLIVSYNFYSTQGREAASGSSCGRRASAARAAVGIWAVSLLLSILPLCGWGRYIPTSWGCSTDCASSYVLCVFVVYSLCFCLLAALSVPLSYRLLCSEEQQLSHAAYQEISQGCPTPGTPAGCSAATPCLSALEPVEQRLKQLPSPCWEAGCGGGVESGAPEPRSVSGAQSRSFTVAFAQRRFSLILSWTKVLLWLPMMIQMVVQHITGFQSLSLETLSFLLTLLAATVTPVFVLSEHWIHLPCGCIINCRRNSYAVSSEELKSKRRGFEFSLSFQQGSGIYRMAPEKPGPGSTQGTTGSTRGTADSARGTTSSAWGTKAITQGSTAITQGGTAITQGGTAITQGSTAITQGGTAAPGRRLSHGESRGPAPADWEWSRSTSHRTPRQKPGGAFAVPLCAFQGTVSLQAPTGKTLSLSTYEVSTEGQRIAPGSKKVEVYRSKSLGHEPDPEEPPSTFADTSVKIHLEVLEICDNEEALDTVSIISNISQSSTQVRSPSLRYSRKENRFVSCDLGETASYSLFIPSHNPDRDVNISIPDTVEAHRLNSQKQHLERGGYQEEIQLLNKAYRRREEDGSSS